MAIRIRAASLPLDEQMRLAGLPPFVPEYRFAPPRRYRFDWCFVELRLAVEREGGTWTGGRHTRASGYAKDCEKYNLAIEKGYRVLRFTADMIRSGKAIATIFRVINQTEKQS